MILPDTQNYSQFFPAIFKSQTQWIVDNRAALNIQMVIGVGDIVNHDNSTTEWTNAVAAANILDGEVPYTFAIGNHDYDGFAPAKRGATSFNKYFGPTRYAGYSWYGGSYRASNENFYTFFTVNGQKYMVLALEFYPRNEVLTWASSVIDSNPDAKVMVVTHSFVFTDGTRVDLCDTNDMSAANGNSGQVVWQKLLYQKPNVILVNSGHLVKTRSAHRSDLGANGNLVNEIFTNFQDDPNGGNGYLRILTYHPSANRIDVKTYSPYLKLYMTSSAFQFSLPVTNDADTATQGAISGKIRTPACSVIPGAQVSTAGFTSTTSSTGLYALPGLAPNGQNGYGLTVHASGYESASGTGTAVAGFTDQEDFYLQQASVSGCTLNPADPSVTICAPAANATVTSPVAVSAGVTSSKAIQYVQIFLDGIKNQELFTKNINTTVSAPTGTHKLTVQFADSAGVITRSSTTFTVGSGTTSAGTTVTINSPANNATVASPVTINAIVTSDKTISYTQIYVDGAAKYTVASKTVNTSLAMASGAHKVTVQAKDSSGIFTKATINITVK